MSADSVALVEPPGFLMMNHGRRTPIVLLIAHIVFGAIVGILALCQGPARARHVELGKVSRPEELSSEKVRRHRTCVLTPDARRLGNESSVFASFVRY